jgi:hypothetical protein
MPTSDELRAALAAAEAEECLAAAKEEAEARAEVARSTILAKMAKATDPGELKALAAELGSVRPEVDPELKLVARETRRAFREMREQYPSTGGVARPAAVETSTGVN